MGSFLGSAAGRPGGDAPGGFFPRPGGPARNASRTQLVEAGDPFRRRAHGQAEGDDSADGRAGDQVEVLHGPQAGGPLAGRLGRGREGPDDAAAVEAENAEGLCLHRVTLPEVSPHPLPLGARLVVTPYSRRAARAESRTVR